MENHQHALRHRAHRLKKRAVTASYFQWVQKVQVFTWSEEQVNNELEKYMLPAYQAVRKVMGDRQVNVRTATFSIAIERVAGAERIRGGL